MFQYRVLDQSSSAWPFHYKSFYEECMWLRHVFLAKCCFRGLQGRIHGFFHGLGLSLERGVKLVVESLSPRKFEDAGGKKRGYTAMDRSVTKSGKLRPDMLA